MQVPFVWHQQVSEKRSKSVLGKNGKQQVMAMTGELTVGYIIYFATGRRKKVNGIFFFFLSKGKGKKPKPLY